MSHGKRTGTNRGGGGGKIAKFERTYFVDDPKRKVGCKEKSDI